MGMSKVMLFILLLIFVNIPIHVIVTGAGISLKNCYDDLGCFPTDYPWFSVLRPFPAPSSPASIDVTLYLCTRRNPIYKQRIDLRPYIRIPLDADFRVERRYNVFIIHGYVNNGNYSWIERMKNAYLRRRDANVFMVDWGKGAIKLNYFQVASNIRVVAAEITRFIEYCMKNFRMKLNSVHLIGHSLGAHTAGYCGKRLGGRIGRITGLDPAQPGFEGTDPRVRLDKDDAKFVEVLHTDTRSFVFFGLGMLSPIGHVDIYANGGYSQPGCPVNIDNLNLDIRKMEDFGKFNPFSIGTIVACSHIRAFEYFIEALETDCVMWARMATLGIKQLQTTGSAVMPIAPVISSRVCSVQTCVPFGLDIQRFPARGIFVLRTGYKSPYCIHEADTTRTLFLSKKSPRNFFTEMFLPLGYELPEDYLI